MPTSAQLRIAVGLLAYVVLAYCYVRREWGGEKCVIFPFTVEISRRCSTGRREYFWGPVKSPYEISPAKAHAANFPPPEAGAPARGGAGAGDLLHEAEGRLTVVWQSGVGGVRC